MFNRHLSLSRLPPVHCSEEMGPCNPVYPAWQFFSASTGAANSQ